jgi:hypothetical protein
MEVSFAFFYQAAHSIVPTAISPDRLLIFGKKANIIFCPRMEHLRMFFLFSICLLLMLLVRRKHHREA